MNKMLIIMLLLLFMIRGKRENVGKGKKKGGTTWTRKGATSSSEAWFRACKLWLLSPSLWWLRCDGLPCHEWWWKNHVVVVSKSMMITMSQMNSNLPDSKKEGRCRCAKEKKMWGRGKTTWYCIDIDLYVIYNVISGEIYNSIHNI